MMRVRSATVVIGANFGDEGKGVAVDALAARAADAVVVRFNGGAQAGHTVMPEHGRRHAFSHIGAGSFAGAATFLSRFFVVHPEILVREAAELAGLGLRPKVIVDPDAPVTTPYDVFINRWAEETRGGRRHGSVGTGFGETIERSERGHAIAVRDLGDAARLSERLACIHTAWMPLRLAELGISLTPERAQAASHPDVVARWLDAVDWFRHTVFPAPIDAIRGRKTIIFEGAQGLRLDQVRGFTFPFVTRSHTGLKNVLALAADAGIEHLEAIYMTRAYLTRHGAGPLPHEVPDLAFADVVDPTNRPNPWQGQLRFAPLDLDALRDTIAADVSAAAATGIAVDAGIGVSCLDQLRSRAEVLVAGSRLQVASPRMAATIADGVGLALALEAHGPVRTAVRLREPDRRGVSRSAETPAALFGGA
jgi:adenylosuccinate synthase